MLIADISSDIQGGGERFQFSKDRHGEFPINTFRFSVKRGCKGAQDFSGNYLDCLPCNPV